jgi:hypothetical protein
LELQFDVGRTRSEYRHLILPPSGVAVTYLGYNNRHVQGWHPAFEFRTWLEDDAWCLALALPFDALGAVPAAGDVWGLNVSRVNANEARGYVQWAPTFGDALRPELFGELRFSGQPGDRQRNIADYARRAAERKAYFVNSINKLREADALRELGVADWAAWAEYMKHRDSIESLRWEGSVPGAAGIPHSERELVIAEADALATQIAGWTVENPDPASFGIATLEVLGDAWLLTKDAKYVKAFDAAMRVHAALMRSILASIDDPHALHYSTNPYHDIQVVNTAIAGHAYITLSRAGLDPATHATMMWTVLRAGRFASHNIRTAFNAGNHQVYESGGLASVAALFPEMRESDEWAAVASRSIRMHLEQEVYPDGGYFERCGYHSVALSFTMHAVALIVLNKAENRFTELMSKSMQATLEHMHDWLLWLNAPDGSFPAFGDCGHSTHMVFLQRGAAIYRRGDLAWQLHQLEPAMVPAGVVPREPKAKSISLESQFTVMRDGWQPDSFYMAVDHGPLGGQHSHPDTLGYVAYAFGRPVAVDSGISTSYEDKRYVTWFRKVRAHNVVVIDDIETEKVAELVDWKPGPEVDVLSIRSLGYKHRMGVTQDRTIYFIKGIGWLIHDRLHADTADGLRGRAIEWLLHTPYALRSHAADRLHATMGDTGLLMHIHDRESVEQPSLTMTPSALFVPKVRPMRLWDIGRRHGRELTSEVTEVSLRHKPVTGNACEFAVLLLPHRGPLPAVNLQRDDERWHLSVGETRGLELRIGR